MIHLKRFISRFYWAILGDTSFRINDVFKLLAQLHFKQQNRTVQRMEIQIIFYGWKLTAGQCYYSYYQLLPYCRYS